MTIVSQNIKYLRKMNGLTQEQFSRRINIKRSLVGAYEEARANPPLDKLKVIANCFGISVDTLIKQDVRKIRQTPDINFGVESSREEPRPLNDLAADFLSKIQTPVEREVPPPPVYVASAPTVAEVPQPTATPVPMRSISELHDSHVSSPIVYVPLAMHVSYAKNYQEAPFIQQLQPIQLPYDFEGIARAFAMSDDFPIPNSVAFGVKIFSWDDIREGQNYVLVTRQHGILYRRVYNQLKVKGTFLLSSDVHAVPSKEVSGSELLEVWEVKGFMSTQLPQPSASFEKVENLVEELTFEIERMKKRY